MESEAVPTRPVESDLLLDDQATAESPTTDFEPVNFPGVGFGDFLRVIVVLGVVIALIYALVWMLRKLTGIKTDSGDEIRIYSTRPIKGNSALHLIEAGKQMFLIGSTSNSINLISEINDKETIDEIRLKSSRMPAPRGFAKLLRDRLSGKQSLAKTKDANNYPTDGSILNLQKQRERLKHL
ncbi:hypothetical protein S1OALGB6SA_421 [Olavius algarvensis spirochete endosymbiont]|uniref:FliO/MopB family protein n=1 Tax=Olavius algarvensis spirochete endosymbiont TaxID=260710 RepID=UPI00052D510C|nr:flagellar biosynthetic protein FliO [Olavius algarvensis spirochete endosymbiont]KGM42626.1 hypothetical protein JY97_12520 [Alkalispirochaeta odontotermitis]VDA99353.1 hypothetical protein S1OALGB6SA_421 [Olavius algarvensis spirochete endosymbiont]